jgi:hypothetical protein
MPQRNRPSVQRKIYFFRVFTRNAHSHKLGPFDHVSALRKVASLSTANGERYYTDAEGQDTLCLVDSVEHSRVRLSNVRRLGLPQVERRCTLSPLNIPDDAGLAETSHFVFFGNGILGAEFNFHGPRASKLETYLSVKSPDQSHGLQFSPVLRGNVQSILKELKQITALRLRIRSAAIPELVAAAPSLGEAFRQLHQASAAEVIELELKPKPRSGAELAREFGSLLKSLAALEGADENITAFKVRGRKEPFGPVHELNVLNELLFVSERIVLGDQRTRGVQTASAYSAIERAHDEYVSELRINAEAES